MSRATAARRAWVSTGRFRAGPGLTPGLDEGGPDWARPRVGPDNGLRAMAGRAAPLLVVPVVLGGGLAVMLPLADRYPRPTLAALAALTGLTALVVVTVALSARRARRPVQVTGTVQTRTARPSVAPELTPTRRPAVQGPRVMVGELVDREAGVADHLLLAGVLASFTGGLLLRPSVMAGGWGLIVPALGLTTLGLGILGRHLWDLCRRATPEASTSRTHERTRA